MAAAKVCVGFMQLPQLMYTRNHKIYISPDPQSLRARSKLVNLQKCSRKCFRLRKGFKLEQLLVKTVPFALHLLKKHYHFHFFLTAQFIVEFQFIVNTLLFLLLSIISDTLHGPKRLTILFALGDRLFEFFLWISFLMSRSFAPLDLLPSYQRTHCDSCHTVYFDL